MNDLDTLIAQLQAIRAEHGNLKCYKDDMEDGISDAEPYLGKVLCFPDSPHLQAWGEASVQGETEMFNEAEFEHSWSQMDEDERSFWGTKEKFFAPVQQRDVERKRFREDYAQQPFAIIF